VPGVHGRRACSHSKMASAVYGHPGPEASPASVKNGIREVFFRSGSVDRPCASSGLPPSTLSIRAHALFQKRSALQLGPRDAIIAAASQMREEEHEIVPNGGLLLSDKPDLLVGRAWFRPDLSKESTGGDVHRSQVGPARESRAK